MRSFWPQISIRQMMELVAVVAITLFGSRAEQQSRHCYWRARYHREEFQSAIDAANRPPVYRVCSLVAQLETHSERPSAAEYKARLLKIAEYHEWAMKQYERAEWRFWARFEDLPADAPES
jgi:hypothetical protein